METKKKVLLISGLSGAGKTSAMSVLEDMGYHCIDQFPVQLLPNLCDVILNSSDPRFDFTALATSSTDFNDFVRILRGSDLDYTILLLDASNDTLLHRYKSTRRMHPLLLKNISNTLEDAIQVERELFNKYKDNSFRMIDTTFLSFNELKKKLEDYFSKSSIPSFSISFLSFGYKHGVPMDADLMFDVRFLPNPYWELSLRAYSGNDKCVYDYVIEKDVTKEYLKKLLDFLDYSFDKYVKEGKNHFTVAIGCTGGQHRSVSITNYLFDHYSKSFNCFKDHRDVEVNDA